MSDDNQSRYKTLAVPAFKSSIPQHLLVKLPETERYIVEALSKAEQQYAWLVDQALENNRQMVETEKRVTINERWREAVTSKWSLLLGVVVVIAPVLVKSLFEYFFIKKP